MVHKLTFHIGLLFCLVLVSAIPYEQSPCDVICGKWESDEKNLIVEVSKSGVDFKARIIWFKADNDQQMHTCADDNNPDAALRSRKLLGLDVLNGLVYQPYSRSWENGLIYDAKHGRYWNASANISDDGSLKVKGYWHFKFIGKTMTFNRL